MIIFLTLLACIGSQPNDSAGPPAPAAICTEPAEVACLDEVILDLSLQDDLVSDGEVVTSTDGNDFVTTVDADAGGIQDAPNNPWVYLRFDADGAHRVDIDDETALTSMEWDLAAKRFILRLNGGSSGPSCVGGASLIEQDYDGVVSVPEGIVYAEDDYYTDDCTLINDSSGLEGSPQVVLGPWWEYPGCVATTGTPFLIQLATGDVLKFVVQAYYGEGQEECNESGSMGTDSAHYTFRWAFL